MDTKHDTKTETQGKAFPAFWFDGNRYHGDITSPADWQTVVDQYAGFMTPDGLLDQSRNDPGWPSDRPPKYGLRFECDGPHTLRQFFTEHGVTL